MGTTRLLGSFIKAQESTLDPILPRIVDVAHQSEVSCANLIRTLLAQGLNVRDLKGPELKFFQKQNVDAWMLPEELKKAGYVQRLNIMGSFDASRVGGEDPLDSEKHQKYEQDVNGLGKYLEQNGQPGSIVPFYYRYSSYK